MDVFSELLVRFGRSHHFCEFQFRTSTVSGCFRAVIGKTGPLTECEAHTPAKLKKRKHRSRPTSQTTGPQRHTVSVQMRAVFTQNALNVYAVLWCLSLLLRFEPSSCQLAAATQQNVDFHDPNTLSQYEVAKQSTGCLWLDSMANGKKYTWRIQPKVYVAGMSNAELTVKIASVTGGDAVWTNATLRAYTCGGRSLVTSDTNCAGASKVEVPLQNSTNGRPVAGSYFESPTNELILEYQASSEVQNSALGNGFTAIWYSRGHCSVDQFVYPENLLGECAPGGLYRLSTSTRARPACSVAYAAGNPGLQGCDLAGYSECPEGAIHGGKCWAVTTTVGVWSVHDQYCREWGGTLAAMNDKDDHMMYARMTSMASQKTLQDVSTGQYGLLWTGICKVGTANDQASFGGCDGSTNVSYIASNPSIWWSATPQYNMPYVRYLRYVASTLPLGEFQGFAGTYTSYGMCARPMPQDMTCEGETCFKRFPPATYAVAQQTCREWGGHLAIAKTALELETVRKLGYGQHDSVAGVAAGQFPAGTPAGRSCIPSRCATVQIASRPHTVTALTGKCSASSWHSMMYVSCCAYVLAYMQQISRTNLSTGCGSA